MAEFISLEQYVRASPTEPDSAPEPDTVQESRQVPELRAALSDVKRFHAGLCDAFEAAREELLRDLAVDVLARELACAPAEIERIAARVLERFADDEPLRVLAHADDAPALAGLGLPIVVDARRRRGDLQVVLRHGSIDVSLGVRLSQLLEAKR